MLVPVFRIKCEGCGREFDWSGNSATEAPPSYHSKSCRGRKRVRLRERGIDPCPHPQKRLFSSHKLATDACNDLGDIYMKPYRCRCGGYHIGHPQMRIVDWIQREVTS